MNLKGLNINYTVYIDETTKLKRKLHIMIKYELIKNPAKPQNLFNETLVIWIF